MSNFKTEKDIINAIITVATAEEGYLEKKSNANLYDKVANAGYANYTKYWVDLTKWGAMRNSGIKEDSPFAGGEKWSWCAAFVCWSFISILGVEGATKLLLHMPYISCQTLANKAKAIGKLEAIPKVGSIVLFFNGSRFSHTGYVIGVDTKKFYTIEGNTNLTSGVVPNGGAVCKKSYVISTYKAKGCKFYYPNYASLLSQNITAPKPNPVPVSKPTMGNSPQVKVNTAKDPLNCRLTPSGNGKLIGTFDKGAVLTLIEKEDASWWKVAGFSSSGAVIAGYCSTKYLVEV